MATFSEITSGVFARRTVHMDIAGQRRAIDVRVLGPDEEALVLEKARAFARERGVESPVDGDPLYDYGVWIHTCALGCVDSESPNDAPRPFFQSVQEILASKRLTRSHIAYLHEMQSIWQDENSPYQRNLADADLVDRLEKIASGDIGPFAELPPVTRWLLVRTMAAEWTGSRADRSTSGGAPPAPTQSTENEPPRESDLQ